MTTTTQTMDAVIQTSYGPPLQVLSHRRVQRPSPGPDEVLVRVHATSVNTPDWVTVTGTPSILRLRSGPWRPRNPVRGTDVAGVVEEAGEGVTDFQPGDEVFGSSWDGVPGSHSGTFAEFAAIPASQLITKPSNVTFVEAAASVMTGLTALAAMRDVAGVTPGTRVLVNGASGGVGTFAVQIAHALGAEVTAVSSTRNLELVRSLGAHHVIDYTSDDLTATGDRYEVILDNVMNHSPAQMARLLAPGGLLIPNSIGTSGGVLGGLPRLARAALLRGTRVKTVTLRVTSEGLTALSALLDSGDLRVVIDETYPLSDAADAVTHMLGHHAQGKVAIAI